MTAHQSIINNHGHATYLGQNIHHYDTRPSEKDNFEKWLNWLGPSNQSTVYHKALDSRQSDTGSWFLKGQTFSNWLGNPASLLWLHGGVGCGKTVLCSAVIERIGSTCNPGDAAKACFATCYFYCSFQDDPTQILSSMLRTIIAKLCSQHLTFSQLETLHSECHRIYPPEVPTNEQLELTLVGILGDCNPQDRATYLIIDALDEIPLPERDDTLAFLQRLSSRHLPRLRVLVTSRDEPSIEEALSHPMQWSSAIIDKQLVNVDIKHYVSNVITTYGRFYRLKQLTKDMILTRLVGDANGMYARMLLQPAPSTTLRFLWIRFRWAALQISALKRLPVISHETIAEALSRLPRDLNETYARILLPLTPVQGGESLSYQASLALKWLVLSARPLFLEELVEACSIRRGIAGIVDPEDRRLGPHGLYEMLHDIISVEPPISQSAVIPDRVHLVTLAHFSVQEFLTGKDIRLTNVQFFEIQEHSHETIARACLAYLYHYNIWLKRSERHPLRDYAWYHWEKHLYTKSNIPSDRLRNKAMRIYKCLDTAKPSFDSPIKEGDLAVFPNLPEADLTRANETDDFVDATDWMPVAGLARLKASLNVPFFYEDFDLFGQYSSVPGDPYLRKGPDCERRECVLLKLLPCLDESTRLTGRLELVDIEDYPIYDALSYTWDYDQGHAEMCIGYAVVKVPSNLASILRRLRHQASTMPIYVWCEALWTRNYYSRYQRQALPQSFIFRRAREVVVGLGDAADSDATGIEYLMQLASTSPKKPPSETSKIPAAFRSVVYRIDRNAAWSSISGLFSRSWWTRAWTVEELVIAVDATLLFGMHSLNMNYIYRVWTTIPLIARLLREKAGSDYKILTENPGWKAAQSISLTKSQFQTGQRLTLPHLLWRFRTHTAMHAEDRVYSLLEILDPVEVDSMNLSRYQGVPRSQFWTAIAQYIVAKYRTLDVFSYRSSIGNPDTLLYRDSGEDPRQELSLPSWVPDFAAPIRTVPLTLGVFCGPTCRAVFCAGGAGSVSTVESFYFSDGTLLLELKIFAYIASLNKFHMGRDHSRQSSLESHFRRIRKNLGSILSSVYPSQPVRHVFWKTLLTDRGHDGQRLRQETIGHSIVPPTTEEEHQQLLQEPSLDSHLKYLGGRQRIITGCGRLGLAPVRAQKGDCIAVFPGGTVPYILRATKPYNHLNPRKEYIFIGECYIHGVMDGEIMRNENIEMQKIFLG